MNKNNPIHQTWGPNQDQAKVFIDGNSVRLNGEFLLTKTGWTQLNQSFIRLPNFEEQCKAWVEQRVGLKQVRKRLETYDPSFGEFEWPKHYPVKFENPPFPQDFQNFLIIFPYALGTHAEKKEDVLSFEFIEMAEKAFRTVVWPRAKEVFVNIEEALPQANTDKEFFEKATYTYGSLHESCHWAQPSSVAKLCQPDASETDYFLTELHSDILSLNLLKEMPEVATSQFLLRIFWYLQNYQDPNDYDKEVAKFFWNLYRRFTVIVERSDGRFEFKPENLDVALEEALEICNEIHEENSFKSHPFLKVHDSLKRVLKLHSEQD